MTPRERSVSRTALVPAPPADVFAVLASPAGHVRIDGSGSLRGVATGPDPLRLGDRFGMRMRIVLPYRITNTVVEFEPDRRIAWRHVMHHVWRWQVEPADGGSLVTETFDWSGARIPRLLEVTGTVAGNTAALQATLVRLRGLFPS